MKTGAKIRESCMVELPWLWHGSRNDQAEFQPVKISFLSAALAKASPAEHLPVMLAIKSAELASANQASACAPQSQPSTSRLGSEAGKNMRISPLFSTKRWKSMVGTIHCLRRIGGGLMEVAALALYLYGRRAFPPIVILVIWTHRAAYVAPGLPKILPEKIITECARLGTTEG